MRLLPLVLLVGAILASRPGSPLAGDDDHFTRRTGTEAGLLAGAAACFAGGLWIEAGRDAPTPADLAGLDPANLPSFDRPAVRNWNPGSAALSDVLAYGSMAAPLALMLDDRGRDRAGTLVLMHAETLLLQGGIVTLIKSAVGRARPYAYNPDPRIPADLRTSRTTLRSFPSGHTASAFASLVFLASVHDELHPDSRTRGWVWGGCVATATATGWLRVRSGRHFLSDVAAGALIGTAVGWLVPRLHDAEDAGSGPSGSAALPLVAWGWAF
ncbi:MAG: phosphatase PAP2 family protein [bacterium]